MPNLMKDDEYFAIVSDHIKVQQNDNYKPIRSLHVNVKCKCHQLRYLIQMNANITC
jgi:hypothetical protein